MQDLTSAELALLVKMSASGILLIAGDPAQSVEEGVDFRFSCKKLRQDDGLCRGPRTGWAMPISHPDLARVARQSSGAGLVILTPVLSEVIIVDFFRCLHERQQAS